MKNTIKNFKIVIFITAVGFLASCGGNETPVEPPAPFMEMVFIPGGTFKMGSSETEALDNSWYDNERPQRQVTLNKFFMGKYLVTQAQYEEVMGINPSYFKDSRLPAGLTTGDNLPVERVSWYDAIEFCNALSELDGLTPYYSINKDNPDPNNTSQYDTVKWLVTTINSANGYRLPTEAQWEYACRAGTTTAFNWGTNQITSDQANYTASFVDPFNTTAGVDLNSTSEVGRYAPNAWGLYDMHGNLSEWCWDWYDEYPDMVQTDPSGAVSSDDRVIRSGSWYFHGRWCRSAFRVYDYPSSKHESIGFRVARP